MVLVFCILNSVCGWFLPLCGALSAVEKLKWIFQPCLLNHCYILTLVCKVVLAQPAIVSITRWFLRRVPCAAELITPSVLNNCCYPPALTFCPSLVFWFCSLPFCKQKSALSHTRIVPAGEDIKLTYIHSQDVYVNPNRDHYIPYSNTNLN